MKRKLTWLAVLAVAGVAVVAAPAAGAAPKDETPAQAAERLRGNARGAVEIAAKRSTGAAAFVRAGRGGDLYPAARGAAPAAKALGFLNEYAALVGVEDATAELVPAGSSTDAQGATHLTYRQVHRGVPVFGGLVRVHVDADGDVTAVNGSLVPDLDLAVTPRLSADEAAARALRDVLANPTPGHGDATPALGAAAMLGTPSVQLVVYREGLIKNVESTNELVYQVEVTNRRDVREIVFVHAGSGKVVNRWSAMHDALHRQLYEQTTANLIWQEGDAFPGALNADQRNIVQFGGDSYHYFFNSFGRDSYDGAGASLRSVNNDPRINCPNANWNGITTNYCNGVTADDVVAHEWGHAYTEYTHGLIYQWQPGALNESYSDIWGEVVDLLNGAGTDSPSPARTVGSCSTHTTPLPTVVINSPPAIAGECRAGGAAFGPPLTAAGVTGDVALANDGIEPGSDACTPLPAGQLAGKIGLVDRGTCGFAIKVKIAQDAGAIGVIVANNAAGVLTMGGADPTITIPSVLISLANGNLIKEQLASTVNVTLKVGSGVTEDSYKWLMGEDATAFGGAIRDMWNPGCLADPGKVSDEDYHCATSDAGGVHTNSGVPNHGFALLVDGGTFNGHTVNPIGMVKAAHVYWRAQAVYQTPTSDFADHADALESSCADLIGVPLEGLSTTSVPAGPSGQSITAADCASVAAMAASVELRGDPTQCNFQPLLRGDAPALCDTKGLPTHYLETFESGLGGWTLTNQGVFAGWPGYNWEQKGSLPGGRSGHAAYGIDPLVGDCAAGAGDVSGVMRMESPLIAIPKGKALGTPLLSFDHYVATEAGWDGGNLKISVNGGPYVQVPQTAFIFNAYNATLQTAAAGNTNPLAGERAFTGTDGGSLGGSWGTTQIDLSAAGLGVVAGDTIRIRFDMGIDGCTGIDGWYVDDVRVSTCNLKSKGTT